MEKRRFGNTDMTVSVLGFGGAEIGFQNIPAKVVEQILMQALDEGLNIIDTAECYPGSEELIGNAIATRRQNCYIFTKCGHGARYDIGEWAPADLELSIDRSLKRLKTDYIDLMQLHSCDEQTLREGGVIEALQRAKKAGKTRYIGYSGDGAAARFAIECGAFDALQTSVSIADQEAIDSNIPLAASKGMGIIAKRPIANAAWRHKARPTDPYQQPYWERIQQLKYEFINGNLSESVAMALRFTLSIPGVNTAIVGTTKPGRWKENADLLGRGPLAKDEFEAIRQKWKSSAKPDWVGQT